MPISKSRISISECGTAISECGTAISECGTAISKSRTARCECRTEAVERGHAFRQRRVFRQGPPIFAWVNSSRVKTESPEPPATMQHCRTFPETNPCHRCLRLQLLLLALWSISAWMCTRTRSRQSNRTDNESAKMATSKGVILGYTGVAAVDKAHQIIVEAHAHGTGSEQEVLLSMVTAMAPVLTEDSLITADAGYHSEANLRDLAARDVDALIADGAMCPVRSARSVYARRRSPRLRQRLFLQPQRPSSPASESNRMRAGRASSVRSSGSAHVIQHDRDRRAAAPMRDGASGAEARRQRRLPANPDRP